MSFSSRILPAFLTAILLSALPLSAQMTDSQVISYIKKARASGKSKSQIGQELFEKGVKEEQMSRLYEKYSGMISNTDESDVYQSKSGIGIVSAANRGDRTGTDDRSPRSEARDVSYSRVVPITDSTRIFGHGIFAAGSRLSFEPNDNVATPANYVLGPGDEVIIDVWGTSEDSISQTVSPEGRIMIPQIGPVQLSGLTIDQATAKLKGLLSRKYAGDAQHGSTQISVTLGKIRSIQVNVMGEVNVPGTYRLSAFSTVFNAIYRAGGVTEVGSLRSVNVTRSGKFIGTADLYAFLFDGESGANFSLQEGDVIVVPPYSAVVEVKGGVRRPMRYEARPSESVDKILRYAGDFTSNASGGEITVERRDATGGRAFLVDAANYSGFGVQDGDVISVHINDNDGVILNRAEIQGAVLWPGVYALGDEIGGVRSLVEHAGGLLPEAFGNRAQIVREKPDRSKEIIAVAIGSILDGSSPDIALQKNDVLVVYDINKIEPKGDLTINGYVLTPGDYPYVEGATIEDLILMAGGLQSGASTVRVDVSRRIEVPSDTLGSEKLAEIFSFGIRDGMMVEGTPDFTLKPYDIVSVRKSPTYLAQNQITVVGEVAFPGQYTIQSSNERISDIIRRAGGLISTSYAGGATMRRRHTQSDKTIHKALVKALDDDSDSTKVTKMYALESYGVGINLANALARPGCDDDIVLRDGDILIIPAYSGVVHIDGEVLYPNAVSYVSGKTVSYYIDQAGGFTEEARKGKVYVVHMNGQIDKGANAPVNPGSMVMVPKKPEHKKMTVAEWLGIGTTAASLTTMIVTIANLVKK